MHEATTTEPAVRIEGLSKHFGTVRALDGVSFEIRPQSIFGLLGPNGAGKTTLFSVAANFIQATSGRVEVLGHDVRDIAKLQGRFSVLPQDALFQRNVPIVEQLAFFRLLAGQDKKTAEQEVRETLEMVGLGEYMHRRVHALSHGMIKRLGVAQAFLGKPEVVLLDEPTSGLDPKNARHIRELIRDLRSRDTTVVVSSHNLAEIQDLCDDVAILAHGRVVTYGSVREITSANQKLEFRLHRPLTDAGRTGVNAVGAVTDLAEQDADRYVASLDLSSQTAEEAIEGVLRALLDSGNTPIEFREGDSLEAYFIKVTDSADDPI